MHVDVPLSTFNEGRWTKSILKASSSGCETLCVPGWIFSILIYSAKGEGVDFQHFQHRSAALSIEIDLLWKILHLADFAAVAVRHAVLALWTEVAVCVDGTSHHVTPGRPILRI